MDNFVHHHFLHLSNPGQNRKCWLRLNLVYVYIEETSTIDFQQKCKYVRSASWLLIRFPAAVYNRTVDSSVGCKLHSVSSESASFFSEMSYNLHNGADKHPDYLLSNSSLSAMSAGCCTDGCIVPRKYIHYLDTNLVFLHLGRRQKRRRRP